jgi:hypothetical protein
VPAVAVFHVVVVVVVIRSDCTEATIRSPINRRHHTTPHPIQRIYLYPPFIPLAILFTRVQIVIIFATDKRFGLVDIGHSGLEGSTIVAGQEAVSRSAVSFMHGILFLPPYLTK